MIIIPDIIEAFINNLDLTLEIESYSNDGENTTIIVENAYNAREDIILTVNTINLRIVSVSGNSIVVPGTIDPITSAVLERPYFFHGTPMMTNSHLSQIQNFDDKTPFAYLLEILSENWDNDPQSNIAVTADIRLFFLDVANFQDWSTDDHYSKRIKGLRNLIELIMHELNESPLFNKFSNYQIINHVKFGEWRDLQGHINSIFDEELSGVELRINLPFNKSLCY